MKVARLCGALVCVAVAFSACSSGTSTVPSSARLGSALRARAPIAGDLYVAETSSNTVKIFAPDSDSEKDRITDAPSPVELAFSQQGILAVASQKGARRPATVSLYQPHATTSYAKIALPLAFGSFHALAFDPKNVLYVASDTTVYAYKLDDLTKPVLTLGKAGTGIHNVRFNTAGDVAVSSKEGVTLYKAGSDKPWGNISGFDAPDAIYDLGGYLCVAEFASDRVGVFPPNSTSPSIEITDGVKNPNALAVDVENNLYVASHGGEHHITVYDDNGTNQIRTINKTSWPREIVVASNGYLYVDREFDLGVDVVAPGATEPSYLLRAKNGDIAVSP